jgi:hypothetical protein
LDNSTRQRLLYGNWDFDDDPAILCQFDKIQDMFSNMHVGSDYQQHKSHSKFKFMSCDISLHGADKFVILVWYKWQVIDMAVLHKKTTYDQANDIIKKMSIKHRVPQSQITYDADGIGGVWRGHLTTAVPFVNGGSPTQRHPRHREQFKNLKAQCYFYLADKINDNEVYFPKELAGKYVGEIAEELALIKNASHNKDQKLAVLTKEELTDILGRSPDFSDAMMMRSVFEVKKAKKFIRRAI